MDKISLLIFFTGLPCIVYLGVQLEILRKRNKYKKDETIITDKYKENLFVLRQKSKSDDDNDDIKKAS